MQRPSFVLFVFGVVAIGVVAAGFTASAARDATPAPGHGPGHGAGDGATPAADSPYADDGRSGAIRALTPEEIAQIERGEGAGFALPAELNGVPGPRHVLDLAHELGLSHQQRAEVQAIFDETRAAVLPAGERYLAAERALEEAFRSGTMTEAELPGRVAEVSRLEGELATLHLVAHLRTAAVLTPEQVAAYNRLRGYE